MKTINPFLAKGRCARLELIWGEGGSRAGKKGCWEKARWTPPGVGSSLSEALAAVHRTQNSGCNDFRMRNTYFLYKNSGANENATTVLLVCLESVVYCVWNELRTHGTPTIDSK